MAPWRIHLFALLILALCTITGGTTALRLALTDLRFAQHSSAPSGDVAIVAIDTQGLEDIGVWPWPRAVYADLLEKLQALGATDVAFDVDFSSRGTPEGDRRFEAQLETFGGAAILPVFKQLMREAGGVPRFAVTRPLPEFAAQSWLGAVNVVPESDGRVRRYGASQVVEGEHIPSLAVLLAGGYGKDAGSFAIDFGIDVRKIPVVSVRDVLAQSPRAHGLKGKKVIIGATAIELGDRFTVPRHGIIAGVELQALATESVLRKRTLAETGFLVPMVCVGLVAGLVALMRSLHVSSGVTAAGLVALVLALEGAARLVQIEAPYIVDTSYGFVAAGSYLAATLAVELNIKSMLASIAQRKFQSIAVSLGDGIICTDAAGRIEFWNPAAASIFGIAEEDARGRPFSSLLAEASAETITLLLEGVDEQAVDVVGLRRDGSTFPLEVRASGWAAEDGRHHSFIARDITIRRKGEERIRFLALNDALTGLPNRTSLCDHIRARIDRSGMAQRFAVLLLDLDKFKEVNDKLGHDGGDVLLRRFADGLRKRLCPGDFASRLGGDEFAMVVDLEARTLEDAVGDIASILGTGTRHTYIDGQGFVLSTSIGSALYPVDGGTVDELLSNADVALYRAKKSGPGLHVAYHRTFKDIIEHRRALEAELRLAHERHEFELFYQPQVRLTDGQIVGAEALIRWRHPEHGIRQPGEFLDVLGASTLSEPVGAWILRSACEQAARWQKAGHRICVGVNLFQAQFTRELPRAIMQTLHETGLPPDLLEIEITENILLVDDEKTIATLTTLRSLGVRVALDDFGTGYASLTHLKRFPLDRLKVDRSFVTRLGSDRKDTAIVAAIVGLGRELDLNTIAEGVESLACAELLRATGCCEGQGYYFGKPLPADQFERLLTTGPFMTSAA